MSDERPTTPAQPDPASWVDEHGDHLFRFALARVGKTQVAEDLVQETFLAALQGLASFAGRSSVRTWLTGILKNKIIDRFRRKQPPTSISDLGLTDDEIDALYDPAGHWRPAPGGWGGNPAELLQQQEFHKAFLQCLAALPDRLREVLTLRVLDEVPPEEVCATMKISANNLWTMLYRARMRLWQCLDRKGQGPTGGKT